MKILILLLIASACAFVWIPSAAALEYQAAPGGSPVAPVITSPKRINQLPHPIESDKPERKEHEKPMEKPSVLPPVASYDPSNPGYVIDKFAESTTRSPEQLSPCQSFIGTLDTGWNPPDPHVAVGPDHVVEVVNSSIAIFDKNTGQKLMQTTASFWFRNTSPAPPSSFIYDPKVVYDPTAGRFVIFYLCTDDVSQASYLVSASASSDAMGNWYSYNFDATLNGTTPSNTWADYPGLGFDYDQAVYLTSNQWIFDGDFVYSKIRILPKTQLYGGLSVSYNDVWDMRYHDNSRAFTVKPASTYSDAGGEYLVSNIWYGSTYTTYWKITDPLLNPSITLQPQVNVPGYPAPPNVAQLGGNAVGTIGPMTQDVVFRNGKVYTAFSESFNWGSGTVSAVRVLGIDVTNSTAAVDYVFGADGKNYFFPSVYVDPNDKIYLVCNRSATSEYISIHYVEDLASNSTSVLLKAGESARAGSAPVRWGDYAGISPDPDDQGKAWLCMEYPSASSGSWYTWIGQAPSKLSAPSLVSPADSATTTLPALLAWNPVTAAQTYELQIADNPSFTTPAVDEFVDTSAYAAAGLADQTTYFWRVRPDGCPNNPWSPTQQFRVCNFLAGDADGNGLVSIGDAVFDINYIFSGGAAPSPEGSGDANCDGTVTVADAVYLVNFVFGGGPAPCRNC